MNQEKKNYSWNSSGIFGQGRNATALAPERNEVVDQTISKWQFYLPDPALAEKILDLNDRIGEDYLSNRYESLAGETVIDNGTGIPVGIADDTEFNRNLNDASWQQRLFNKMSSILFHTDEAGPDNSGEKVSFFQKYVSERIYNHLAMLIRSPYAKKGGVFSLKEDFADEIAGKIGLGMLYSDGVTCEMRDEINYVILELAKDFQEWFINKKDGYISATFGEVLSAERANHAQVKEGVPKLILTADL